MSTPAKTDPDLPSPPPARRVVIDVTWTDGARAALQNSLPASPNSAEKPQTSQPQTVRIWNRALRNAIALTCAHAQPHAHAARYLERHLQTQPENQSWKIDATFVSDPEMTELNARYRGKNRPTDVLSFAQSEDDFEEDDFEEDVANFAFGAPDEIVWGDLIIAVETTQRQASERAHDVATEVGFLSIHGTLHLLGYDHQNSTQRRAMWRAQERIFEIATARK